MWILARDVLIAMIMRVAIKEYLLVFCPLRKMRKTEVKRVTT